MASVTHTAGWRDAAGSTGSIVRACCIAIAIACGVGFRFYHLSSHGFWGDEHTTAMHAAGYTESDVVEALSQGRPLSAGALNRFVTGLRSPLDTVRALQSSDVTHVPPAYYVMLQLWERAGGSSVTSLRLFSALLSLIWLPAAFWLAWELFGSRIVAWVSAAITAVSPFNVEYAQQAREYVLWGALVLIGSALLVRGLKRTSSLLWLAYAVVTAAAFYTYLMHVLVAAGQAAYAALTKRTASGFTPFAVALACAAAAAAPLYYYALTHWNGYASHIYQPENVHGAIYSWFVALASPFADLELFDPRFYLPAALIVVLEATAIVAVVRETPFRQWWFIVTLLISTTLLEVGDTALSDNPRYLMPTLLALQLVVAWFVATRGAAGTTILAAIVALGIGDCAVRSQQFLWWTNMYGAPLRPIAALIDTGSPSALVVGDPQDWRVAFDLAPFLRPTDRIWLVDEPRKWDAAGATQTYLFSRYTSLRESVGHRVTLEPLPVTVPLSGFGLLNAARNHKPGEEQVTWLWRAVRNGSDDR